VCLPWEGRRQGISVKEQRGVTEVLVASRRINGKGKARLLTGGSKLTMAVEERGGSKEKLDRKEFGILWGGPCPRVFGGIGLENFGSWEKKHCCKKEKIKKVRKLPLKKGTTPTEEGKLLLNISRKEGRNFL